MLEVCSECDSSSKLVRACCSVLSSLRLTGFVFAYSLSLKLKAYLCFPLPPPTKITLLRHSLRSLEYDPPCTHAHSCFPVISLFRFRYSPHPHSNSSTSSLEQTGGPGTLLSPVLSRGLLLRVCLQSDFGLLNFKTLAPADKSHLWIAACDVLALVVFIWQVIAESLGGPTDYAAGLHSLAAARLWFASTIRITCVLVIIAMTLLHVRLARPVDFGKSHWLIWVPGLSLIITSTAVAGKSLCSFLLVFLTLIHCRCSRRCQSSEFLRWNNHLFFHSHLPRCRCPCRSRWYPCYYPPQPRVLC